MPVLRNTVDRCVESLCSQGCNRVSGFIAALRAGQEFPEVAGMGRKERLLVLGELVSVMAAYDGRCER